MKTLLTSLLAFLTHGVCLAGDKEDPPSPVEKALRLRGKPPLSAPPTPLAVEFKGGDALITATVVEMVPETRRVTQNIVEQVPVTERVAVTVDGKVREEQRVVLRAVTRQVERNVTVHRAVLRLVQTRLDLRAAKAFQLDKEGKLQPLDATRLPNLIGKDGRVMTIESAEVDPRHLELIRPGTVFLLGNRGPEFH